MIKKMSVSVLWQKYNSIVHLVPLSQDFSEEPKMLFFMFFSIQINLIYWTQDTGYFLLVLSR